jgi:hypothetical protein
MNHAEKLALFALVTRLQAKEDARRAACSRAGKIGGKAVTPKKLAHLAKAREARAAKKAESLMNVTAPALRREANVAGNCEDVKE